MGTQATIMVAASDMSGASIKKYVTAGFISSPKPTLQFAEQRGNLLSDAQEGVSIRKWAAEDCLKNCYNATIELDFNRDIVDVIEYPKFVKEAAALGEKLTQLNDDKRLVEIKWTQTYKLLLRAQATEKSLEYKMTMT